MFSNDRYQTRGIQEELALNLQLLLWGLIDQAKEEGKELDYLQVFEIEEIEKSTTRRKVKIKHTQEIPVREEEYTLEIEREGEWISTKVYIIDDGSHSTMLLAREY